MKTVLCYGDSNTWGYDPNYKEEGMYRHDTNTRWTRLLGQTLGKGYDVIEEGFGGRTTVFRDVATPGRNGLDSLVPILQSHQPLDLIVFMLGTNDTKAVYAAPIAEISAGMEALLKATLNPYIYDSRKPPAILVISPILVSDDIFDCMFGELGMFDAQSIAKSKQLAGAYARLADTYGCGFLNAAEYASPAAGEGIHLDAAGHKALAGAIATKVQEMLA